MNLIERLQFEIQTDTEDPDQQSAHLLRTWTEANPKQREVLDSAFIALCSYTLSSLTAANGS